MKNGTFKKAAVSAALAAAVLIVPAGAHYMALDGITIMPNEETQKFWETWKYPLNEQGIYEHSADGWSFCPELNDGLLLIQDTVSPTEEYVTWDNYVDKNGQLHDLNKGRYQTMYSFSGGLASVKSVNSEKQNYMYNVGYVDTKGNEVIPCNDDWCSFQYDSLWYQGAFKNGKTVVLREPYRDPGPAPSVSVEDPYTCNYESAYPEKWYGVEYAYIDTKGNLLTDWKLTQDIDTVISLPLYDQDGISLYQRVHGIDQNAPEVPVEPEEPEVETTYGQSTATFKGYTIDKNHVGRLLIDVTNNGKAPDEGDLFYLTYCKFIESTDIIDAGSYVPYNNILKIHYEVEAGETKTLSLAVSFLANDDQELTDDQIAAGWYTHENIESSRVVLAQTETPAEAEDLTTFFKAAHDYGEMGLTYEPDADGVVILAVPMPTIQRAQYLDQKLSAFTSQF